MIKAISCFIAVLSMLTSCDCYQEVTGTILDKESKLPVNGVAIGKYETEDPKNSYSRRVYSDSTGYFNYHRISGGLFGCPDVELFFSKAGYVTSKLTFSSSDDNIVYMEKVK